MPGSQFLPIPDTGVFNLFNLRKHIIFKRFKDYHFRRHLKPVFIFFAMSVAITIYSNLDITMLGFMRDNTEVGYYDVAIKIKVILVNIVTSLGAVLLPRTSYYVEMKMEREFRTVSGKALEFVAVLSIPLTVSFTIMAKQCILLFIRECVPSVCDPHVHHYAYADPYRRQQCFWCPDAGPTGKRNDRSVFGMCRSCG